MSKLIGILVCLCCILSAPIFGRDPSYGMNRNPTYSRYTIGDWTYGAPNVLEYNQGCHLTIGRYCSIAATATFVLGGEHAKKWVTTYPFYGAWPELQHLSEPPHSKGNIVVGNDVWIGTQATILSGVHIGDGVIVAAGSVVTKDIPAYAVVGGVPAKILRYRVPEHLIEKLEKIAWWHWPEDKVVAAMPLMLSEDIEKFVSAYSIE